MEKDYSQFNGLDWAEHWSQQSEENYRKFLKEQDVCKHDYAVTQSTYNPTGLLVCRKCGKM